MAHQRTPSLTTPSGSGPSTISPPNFSLPLTPDEYAGHQDQQVQECTDAAFSLSDWEAVSGSWLSYDELYSSKKTSLYMPWLKGGELTYLDSFGHLLNNGSATHESGVLPKRPLSDADHSQQPRGRKHPRVEVDARHPSVFDEDGSDDEIVYGEPHAELGVIDGKHACTCGNRYTRHTTLRRHIDTQSATSRHPCLRCDQTFTREDSLRRHEKMKHDSSKIACPGCKKFVRPDYLSKHLASSQNAKCRVLAEAVHFQTHGLDNVSTRPPIEDYWIPGLSVVLGVRSHVSQRPPIVRPSTDALARSLLVEKPARSQPLSRRMCEPCDLCGMPLGPGEQELIDHIGLHSLDFSAKAFKCKQCDISFAFSADLALHEKAAKNGHCGFKFLHRDLKVAPSCCTGHHPPSRCMQEIDEHKAMQEKLWAWENCQLRAHRLTIARSLSERLQCRQSLRHSVLDNDLSCMAILSRLSMASINSFRSVPSWLRFQEKLDLESLDADMQGLDLLASEDHDDGKTESLNDVPSKPSARPESTVLEPNMLDSTCHPRSEMLDFTMAWENGRFKPVLRNTPGAQPLPSNSKLEMSGNTYVDQLRNMRSPGGLKTKASGVRFRAKAAARYLAPGHRRLDDVGEIVYVQSGMA